MTSKSRDGNFAGPTDQSAPDSQFSSPDELITFAQGYFASDFPNPERFDCAIKGTLSGLVRSGKAPDDRLRSHLFGCSECFDEYQNALAAYGAEMKSVAAAAYPWWTKVVAVPPLRPVPILACALLLILFGFVGLVFVGSYVSRGSRHAALCCPGTEETSPSHVKTADRSMPPSFPEQTSQQKAPVARPRARLSTEGEFIASIDLRDYAMTRGGDGGGSEAQFPRTRTIVLVKLSEGSRKGFYLISVVNAAGKTLETTRARSSDGKTLTATLNLQRLPPQKYVLRISRKGEPPVDVPIGVHPIRKD
jgi:hypothetical protein